MKDSTITTYVTTTAVKPGEVPKEAMMEMMGFGPMSGQMEEIKGDVTEYNIPRETLDFLEKESKESLQRKIDFNDACNGPSYVMLSSKNNMRKFWFGILPLNEDSAKNLSKDDDPNQDKYGLYVGYGISLVHRSSGQYPEGLLLWIPDFAVFAVYDVQEFNLKVFPDATWNDIEENIGLYICSKWGLPEEIVKVDTIYRYFNPWEKWKFMEEGEE